MKSVEFEDKILQIVKSGLTWGGSAEFFNGTLFVSGIMPDEAHMILRDLKDQAGRVSMNQMGSYQTDYTFTYDFQ